MKKITLIITTIILIFMLKLNAQNRLYSNLNFFDKIDLKLPDLRFNDYQIENKNRFENFVFAYVEDAMDGEVYGQVSIFFVKKNYNGIKNEYFFNGNNHKMLNDSIIFYLNNNLKKLIKNFDIYAYFIDKKYLHKKDWQSTETRKIVTFYYPNKNSNCQVYKYTSNGWLLIDQITSDNPTRVIGEVYLEILSYAKIYKYLINKELSKFNQIDINKANQILLDIDNINSSLSPKKGQEYASNLLTLKKDIQLDSLLSKNKNIITLVSWNRALKIILKDTVKINDELKRKIRTTINTLYATEDYKFKNDKIFGIYSLFPWYFPYTFNPSFDGKLNLLIEKLSDIKNLNSRTECKFLKE